MQPTNSYSPSAKLRAAMAAWKDPQAYMRKPPCDRLAAAFAVARDAESIELAILRINLRESDTRRCIAEGRTDDYANDERPVTPKDHRVRVFGLLGPPKKRPYPRSKGTAMTTNLLDGPQQRDAFRDFLAEHRLEQSSRGRVSSRVLKMGFGSTPTKPAVRELLRLKLDWMPAAWLRLYQEFTHDSSVGLTDLMPTESEIAKLLPSSTAPKKPGRKFVGVQQTPMGKYQAVLDVNGTCKYLGTFSDAYLAALEYDRHARITPLKSGRARKLNFMIHNPLASTPEPVTFNRRLAA